MSPLRPLAQDHVPGREQDDQRAQQKDQPHRRVILLMLVSVPDASPIIGPGDRVRSRWPFGNPTSAQTSDVLGEFSVPDHGEHSGSDTEPSVPVLVTAEGPQKVDPAEDRPRDIAEIVLAVDALPQ